MGRGKVELKLIENPTARHVTFSKRKLGLKKKAFQLSLLCDAEVALIISSSAGRLFPYGSHNIEETVERYRHYHGDHEAGKNQTLEMCKASSAHEMNISQEEINLKALRSRLKVLKGKLKPLEQSVRNLMGEDLDSLSVAKLEVLEKKLDKGVKKIRSVKNKCIFESRKLLNLEVRSMKEENMHWKKILDKSSTSNNISPAESLQLLYENTNEEAGASEEGHITQIPYSSSLDLRL